MVSEAQARAHLHVGAHQVEMIVANTDIHPQVRERREMVLEINTGLASVFASSERREVVRIATRIEEEALRLAQADYVEAGFDHVTMPEMRQIAFRAHRQSVARRF